MPEILIIGAGAIGRGFLPWLFADPYDLVFIDSNEKLVKTLLERGGYTTYMVKDQSLVPRTFKVKAAYVPQQFKPSEHKEVVAAFVNVGPRKSGVAAKVAGPCSCPIVLCENDPNTVDTVKHAVDSEKVYFAIPDVITSNSAPPNLLLKDPLSVVSEWGKLFVDGRVKDLKGEFTPCSPDELRKHWLAKLYLHNTPHCIVAYLAAYTHLTYVHEAMQVKKISQIVNGAMDEMLKALKLSTDIPHDFLEWYAKKELRRFACTFLYDPVSRVAREPLRKLERDGRLLGAAQLCLSRGFIPNNILRGITSAIFFDNQNDPDNHMSFMTKALPSQVLLTHILNLRKGEALEVILSQNLQTIISELQDLFMEVSRQAIRHHYAA